MGKRHGSLPHPSPFHATALESDGLLCACCYFTPSTHLYERILYYRCPTLGSQIMTLPIMLMGRRVPSTLPGSGSSGAHSLHPFTDRDGCLLSRVARYDHLNAPIAAHTLHSLLGLLLCNPQNATDPLHPGLSGRPPPTWYPPPRPSFAWLPGEAPHDTHVDTAHPKRSKPQHRWTIYFSLLRPIL
jgi:hypothetical protein